MLLPRNIYAFTLQKHRYYNVILKLLTVNNIRFLQKRDHNLMNKRLISPMYNRGFTYENEVGANACKKRLPLQSIEVTIYPQWG